jgi:hypothetical protein
MKTQWFTTVISLLFLICGYSAVAQVNDPIIETYRAYLNSHKDLSTVDLLGAFPAGPFTKNISTVVPNILYLDSVIQKYTLTNYEQSLLSQHGFMVSERLSYESFGAAYIDIWKKDLPVFVSSDAILHAWHRSYDRMLMDIERSMLYWELDTLLSELHAQVPILAAKYRSDRAMTMMLKDVDVYLAVPRILLGSVTTPYYTENDALISSLLDDIKNECPVSIALFSSTPRTIDFSQFKVRGHYTNPQFPRLGKYFQAMMWLGKIELYLSAPKGIDGPIPTEADIQRSIIDAVLLLEAAQQADAFPLLGNIDSIIRFFVGESDNVTLQNIQQLTTVISVTSSNQLLNPVVLKSFQDSLLTKGYAFQRILSQILMSDAMSPESIVPASSFLLFGQRFVIDSYITGQVVYDRILYNGEKVRRMLPSTLDVLFGLGNNATAQLLKEELDQYHYGTNLAALRYLVEQYGSEFWGSSLFNLWLQAIRNLNPPANRDSLPAFMRTAAWWQEKINTQLASWAELRHDNLLYAKQSYSGGASCSYPYGYVEPIPALYTSMQNLAQIGIEKFQSIEFSNPYMKYYIINYLSGINKILDTLTCISRKELQNDLLDPAETSFLQRIIYEQGGCVVTYAGWYTRFFYGDYGEGENFLKPDYLIADIHTAPTDESGTPVGWVLHAGTGKVDLGVFIGEQSSGQAIAYAGPVASYHEYVTTNFLRLSDEEWRASYLFNSTRPSFVNLYLADTLGEDKGDGVNLMTSVDEPSEQTISISTILHNNYPNPFNSSTIISYSVPSTLTNSKTELDIYNVEGKLVTRLLNKTLPAGNYMTKWDGTDRMGKSVASGIYLYRITIGSNSVSGKIIVIK